MSVNFTVWAQKSDTEKVYLVETSVRRLSDGAILPLYLASQNILLETRFYLGCTIGLPRLIRQANGILNPNRVSTWGELELQLEPDYCPDAQNSVNWLELLSSAYNFRGQPLTIKVGDPAWAYADFMTIFTGRLDKYSFDDTSMQAVVYDKAQDLNQKMPDYALPESPRVVEDSWDAAVPLVMGAAKNYKPTLITSASPGGYPWKYALCCHVLHDVLNAYWSNALLSSGAISFVQKDVLPARKDGEGSAVLDVFGPYTGALSVAEWLVEIDSITALNSQGNSGPAVGLARFRWKLTGDAAWRGENLLTWKLGYDSTTLVKSPAVGAGVMAVSGEYTGDCKLNYKIKITRPGDIGDVIPPQFIWSDDNGDTWLPLNSSTWTPIAAAPGVSSVAAYNPGDSVLWEITTGGNVGGAVRFKWSRDGGATWTTNVQIPDTSPIELFTGFSIQFTAPGLGGTDDYDAGDAGESSSAVDLPAIENTPVALNRGLSAAFSGSGVWYDDPQWVRVGTAPGAMSIASIDPAYDAALLEVIIDNPGNVGGAVTFKWQYNSGGWHINFSIPDTNPIELFTGLSVQFTAPGGPADEYDLGDAWVNIPYYVSAFIVDDAWAWGFKEIPIPLADGVSVQFIDRATALAQGVDEARFLSSPDDFALGDNWNFILGSTVAFALQITSGTITVDVLGLVTPAIGYTDKIGEMIRALPQVWRGWTDADFDLPALTAFNAAIPYQAALVVGSPTDIASIIDQLLTGIPALYTMTQAGKFFIAELAPPAGEPVLELTDVDLQQAPEGEDGDDDLYRRVYLHYDRNYNPENNPPNAPSQERLAWLEREFRQVSARDETVLSNYPWAGDLGPLDTCLVLRDEAKALAAKNLELLKTKHPNIKVVIKTQPFLLDIWQPVSVRRSRYGEVVGQVYAIAGKEENYTASETIMNLWR
jgi:hypothetical protein